ncbi:MAG: hypothetical protein J7513_04375 [Solirubrobacteraceae bacterium]|nr:hypothetical protein [Solirubrobacteraceae bacterium]
MARITCFTLPVAGHVTPLVPVVAALARQGHAVRVVADGVLGSRFADVGAAVASYPEDDAALLRAPSPNFLEVAGVLATRTERTLLAAAIEELQRQPADVVVVDSMAPWGRLAAELLGLPAVTSCSSFVITPRLGATRQGTVDVLRRLPQGVGGLAAIGRARAALRHRFGVDCGGPMRLLANRTATTIVHTSRAFHPPLGRLGQQVQFVGATAAGERNDVPVDPAGALGEALDAADAGAPLVYVALGTIYNRRPAFLRACAEALADGDRRVVISVASAQLREEIGPLPDSVVAAVMPPQLAILDRAQLFVSHGGLNSVHEALWRGVPMILYPQAADQPVVAARAARLGAGVVLGARNPDAASVRAAAATLLAGAAAERATALGQGLRDGGGAERAAAIILAACA